MTRLHDLYEQHGQSPWIDNLRRGWITSGQLRGMVDQGVRGITSNPTIFQKAMSADDDYDDPLRSLLHAGHDVESSYWSLVVDDIRAAADVLAPVHDHSTGRDGFVSVEVDPSLARRPTETAAAARELGERVDRPNLLVKIPGTSEGLEAIRQMISEGRSINVTLIFSLDRYEAVIDAYLAGLEAHPRDLSRVASVASFFVSRVDTEVDRRLEAIGSPEALALRGRAAVAQAKLAYQIFQRRFSGPRWDALAARGAQVQRPLWASTSVKDPAYRDTMYVEELIGPDTVNTMPDATLEAFEDHGTVARSVDRAVDEAEAALGALASVGVDLDDVTAQLEDEGIAAFAKSFDELLTGLGDKASRLA